MEVFPKKLFQHLEIWIRNFNGENKPKTDIQLPKEKGQTQRDFINHRAALTVFPL